MLPRRVPRHLQPARTSRSSTPTARASTASPSAASSSASTEYELDCLIYATGFEVGTDFTRRAGYELIGRDGLTLTEKWHDGASTLHGMHTRGFPNLLIFSLQQSGFTANFPHMLDEQSQPRRLHPAPRRSTTTSSTFEVTQEAEDAWVQTILELAQFNLDFLESCTPGYYNNEGKPSERGIRNGFYGAGSVAFFKVIADWRAKGDLPGLELTPPPDHSSSVRIPVAVRPGSGPRRHAVERLAAWPARRTRRCSSPAVVRTPTIQPMRRRPADRRQRGHDLAARPEQLEAQHRVVVEEEGDAVTVAAHDGVAHGERSVLAQASGQPIEAQLVARALEDGEIGETQSRHPSTLPATSGVVDSRAAGS